ncbi:hypothetical protein AAG906_027953 [Vitis piasezkii]
MAKTRGAKSLETSVQDAIPEPPRPLVVPPPIEDAPLSPSSRIYETRRPPTTPGVSSLRAKKSGSHPPKKKARVSEPIDLSEPSSEPPTEPQPSQPPATESQIPSGMTPEVVIKRPMLRDSFHLLQRYHMEHFMTPRDFFYPCVTLDFYQSMNTHQVRDPTVIHFTIDGRHGILGAKHIAEALRIPYELARPEDYRV